jgi:acid phosphatase (class A)
MNSCKLLSIALAALSLSGCVTGRFYLYRLFGHDQYYISAERPLAAVPAPPAAGSPADKGDLEELLEWQEKRTEADCDAAKAQATADFGRFFGDISPFPDPLPSEVSEILFKVFYDGGAAVSAAKDKFGRERPFRRHSGVKPCVGKASGLSYPSGHATVSRLFALLFSDVYPPGRAEFLSRSDQAALNRVIGGVHHPSDIEAGKALGDAIYAELLKEPLFQKDLERLREIAGRKHPGLPAASKGADGP